MYPFMRLGWQLFKHRNEAALPPNGVHKSQHYCLPIDLDPWKELNNGRTLTLYDMGRLPLSRRIGLLAALKRRGWGLTVAGASVRYRTRVTLWTKFEMLSRAIGRDERFFYLQQSMWKNGKPLNSILIRAAVYDKSGIIPTDQVVAEMGHPDWRPKLPDWVQAWITAEDSRVWPPEF